MIRVRDIMRTDVITVTPETRLRDLLELLTNKRITGVPVIDEGDRVVGMVAVTDVVRHLALAVAGAKVEPSTATLEEAEPGALWSWAEAAGIEVLIRPGAHDATVADVMTPMAFSLSPDAPMSEAARAMYREGTHRVIVTEGDRLVGIVTVSDVAKSVAGGAGERNG